KSDRSRDSLFFLLVYRRYYQRKIRDIPSLNHVLVRTDVESSSANYAFSVGSC